MFDLPRALRLVSLLGLVLGAWPAVAQPPEVTAARIGLRDKVTRFVLVLSEPVPFETFTLADPYRLVIDLAEVTWRLPAELGGRGAGSVSGFRYGLFRPGSSRVVLDLRAPIRVKSAYVLPAGDSRTHRLVVDMEETSAEAFQAALKPPNGPPSPAKAAESPSPAKAAENGAQRSSEAMAVLIERPKPGGRRILVLDPGHGGVDPGAVGAAGTQEKALTLAIAEELKRQLAADPRYQVVLTRESDVFMRLTERVATARTAGAHLFISLHADTLSSAQVRGASVYTLSERGSDQAAEVLAAKENRADVIAGVDVSNYNPDVTSILIDLSQRESKNDAARFANMLIDEMGKDTTVLHKTHRFAAFAVLKAPDVPSVLVELGYLSNRREERELGSSRHRAKLAAAIRRAVDAYFSYQDALTRS